MKVEEADATTTAAEENKSAATGDDAAVTPISYPLQVVYCVKCGLPPEYCEWSARGNDLDECKKWLAENHPELFESIYPPEDGAEESKDGGQ